MLSEALKSLFRQETGDVAEPFLWSDIEVYTYLDDAQKMFCRLTDGISDATTAEVTQIDVSAGDTWCDLHPSILKIRGATRASDGCSLILLNHEDLATRGLRFVPGRSSPLRTVITGMEENKLRLFDAASVDDGIELLVFRLPIADITADGQTLEIPAQHQSHLLAWAKHRAYRKQDSEVFDEVKADEFEAQFRRYCEDTRKEQERKRHKGVRTVAYGGI